MQASCAFSDRPANEQAKAFENAKDEEKLLVALFADAECVFYRLLLDEHAEVSVNWIVGHMAYFLNKTELSEDEKQVLREFISQESSVENENEIDRSNVGVNPEHAGQGGGAGNVSISKETYRNLLASARSWLRRKVGGVGPSRLGDLSMDKVFFGDRPKDAARNRCSQYSFFQSGRWDSTYFPDPFSVDGKTTEHLSSQGATCLSSQEDDGPRNLGRFLIAQNFMPAEVLNQRRTLGTDFQDARPTDSYGPHPIRYGPHPIENHTKIFFIEHLNTMLQPSSPITDKNWFDMVLGQPLSSPTIPTSETDEDNGYVRELASDFRSKSSEILWGTMQAMHRHFFATLYLRFYLHEGDGP